ncbi:MAG: acyl-CoA acyltransferase [Xanthobacteraceae bacterium]|nr:acyl-CoA acyltransferase [Xanthobacteraceae bacterium]
MPAIRCRQIIDSDVPEITALLARGFPSRDAQFWSNALAQLGARQPPAGLPQYGYLLESDNRPVGAILLICAELRTADTSVRRCNLSSWYVEPAFRSYAALLVSRALTHKDVTFLNVSAAPHTWPIIEAQGFSRYSDGVFVAVPALNGLFGSPGVAILDAHTRPAVAFDPLEQDILLQHADLGCISLWCATSERAYPFVFRPRRVKRLLPCAQLIYCRDVGDFVRFAGPLGRRLLRHGRPFVIIDANAPMPGLVGLYRGGSMPRYFKGPQKPRLGDLAYTEYAVLGV